MGDTSPTLQAGNTDICKIEEGNKDVMYRIRKLTTRETGRLMNFHDRDIDKQLEVVSNTQAYKEHGNSICKCVLMAIFSQMGIAGVPKWNDINDYLRYLIIYGSDEKWYQAEERGVRSDN